MGRGIKHVSTMRADDWGAASLFGLAQAKQAWAFHASLPSYEPTALKRLEGLAGRLGLGAVFVKDESTRFGLNAFKGLGGSYCVARLLAGRAGIPEGELTFARLQREDVRQVANALTLITATGSDHGRGIAWTARELSCKAVVYMPKGSSPERLGNIRALGAQAEVTDLNYDDTARLAARRAQEHGWELAQDTA